MTNELGKKKNRSTPKTNTTIFSTQEQNSNFIIVIYSKLFIV
jgi:hypothetical protein